MGFLISINGADFEAYRGVVDAPSPHSYLRGLAGADAISPVQSRTEDKTGAGFERSTQAKGVQQYQEVLEAPKKHPKRAVLARDVMATEVQVLFPSDPISMALEMMRTQGFRHLPIVNEDRQVRGILSDRDLLAMPDDTEINTIVAEQVMTKKVLVCTADTLLLEVARVFLHERINSLPVVDEANTLIGLVTTSDILKGLINKVPLELWT